MIDSTDLTHLRRCVELAREALEAGDAPFGSVLVDQAGTVVKEERNRTVTGADPTYHPEFILAQWAGKNLSSGERAAATVYTSGEHCPMCSAAHGFAGLGRIVYASSSEQLGHWMAELGQEKGRVRSLAVNEVAPSVPVDGPAEGLDEEVRKLHRLKAKAS